MPALRKAQQLYDNAEPEDTSVANDPAQAWVEDKAEQLIMSVDVMFKPRFGAPIGVLQTQFVAKLAEHLRMLQETEQDDLNALARLLLQVACGGPAKSMIEDVLGTSEHNRGKLYEIAEDMLKPFAADALVAEADDYAG